MKSPCPCINKIVLSIAISCMLHACAHLPADPNYPGPTALPKTITSQYIYAPYQGDCRVKVIEDRGSYVFKKITFPSANDTMMGEKIRLEYLDPKGDGKAPVIIILPVLKGAGNIIKDFARFYAKHGYAALIVNRKKRYLKDYDLTRVNDILQEIVINHKQVLDWIETQPDLDAERIGVFGISLGGIKGALISQLDKRVRASVIAMGGGDLPYVLAYSKEGSVEKKRNEYMKKNGLTVEEYHDILKQRITCDPMHFAPYMDARNTMMILALFDQCVPFTKGKELRDRMGKPETIYLFSGHYTSLLFKAYVKHATLKFFNKKMGP